MPTVLRFANVRVLIYPNDHRPAHVHVIGPQGEAVFYLRCPDGPAELREAIGFALHELNRIVDRLNESLAGLCRHWSNIHDPD